MYMHIIIVSLNLIKVNTGEERAKRIRYSICSFNHQQIYTNKEKP
jgi:hypothetical protein